MLQVIAADKPSDIIHLFDKEEKNKLNLLYKHCIMTKITLLAIIFSIFSITLIKGQIGTSLSKYGPVIHAHWKLSSKKISDCEYDLIFTVSIDKDWHIPSILKIKGAEDETYPTAIIFKPNINYSLVGNLTETKPKSEYDETIKKTVYYHFNKAVFTQRIKLNSKTKIKIDGTYEHQICDNIKCDFPPKDKFSFDLQGTSACIK